MAMQMQSGNAVASEKMHQGGGGGGGGGGEGLPQQQQQGRGQQQWWPNHQPTQSLVQLDEFSTWLRGEFAAANAMIDALCHHLRMLGEPGEYDGVIGSIQQRRCTWNHVLHMQQYMSVNDVVYALQQVGFRKNQHHQQQQRVFEGTGKAGKEYSHRRGGGGGRGGHKWDGGFRDGKEGHHHGQNFGNSDGVPHLKEMNEGQNLENGEGKIKNGKVEEIKESAVKPEVDSSVESTVCRDAASTGEMVFMTDTHSGGIAHKKENYTVIPKTFVADRIVEGRTVNEVDGLKLFEELLDRSEVSKLVTLVNELRNAGKKGQLQGKTFMAFKRPMKGHGREMIQFGLPIADAPLEVEVTAGTSRGMLAMILVFYWKIEPIPSLFEDVIERLVTLEIVSEKPDCCMIDFFNMGDHSLPQPFPNWYGRPVCVLFLTECDMTFGKVIVVERPGDFIGSLKLSLMPGSMLALEGRSCSFAKHAIPSTSNQRILVTFVKSMPKKVTSGDAQHFPFAAPQLPSWVPPPSRSPNHIRHPGPKHYGSVPTSGVLPASSARPTLPSPNGIQTIFVPAAVAPAMPFPVPVPLPPASTGWPAAPPRHSAPRLPVPGTGVFLPGTGNSANQSSTISSTNDNPIVEARPGQENQEVNPEVKSPSSKGTNDEKAGHQECNGTIDGSNGLTATEEHPQRDDIKDTEEPTGAGLS
ncbi:OLC1v1033117C1 [Oldenlandia corymbosa var. corymbosa]|uniref:OLC1v1033117C1 n=1 Tax=Oldenlandia corymbosa var. corymbosa TaxID=529605 RepID=A0AAV1CNC7_OLDCO|nr:OLC1v1033117C1 [Oldenlandia corymbosa var. corymbosa]